jgi:aminocarboxymuconate-semialdehyde decarboxylase
MDRDGIDVQLLCATPFLFAYQRAPSRRSAARTVAAALEICAGGSHGILAPSRRLHALCQVPLQDTDLACRELTRAMRAGHVGVQIGNHVGPRNMDDEGIVTFLQHCADENAPVLVHPWDMLGAERTQRYMMGWTVGMPAETQLSIVSMILGGVSTGSRAT